MDDDGEEFEANDPAIEAENALVCQVEHTFDKQVFEEEEWLQILKEKEVIDELLNGNEIPLGTSNQVEVVAQKILYSLLLMKMMMNKKASLLKNRLKLLQKMKNKNLSK